jgi:hypothetical protein
MMSEGCWSTHEKGAIHCVKPGGGPAIKSPVVGKLEVK